MNIHKKRELNESLLNTLFDKFTSTSIFDSMALGNTDHLALELLMDEKV